jgi:hypothetical protein
LGTVALEPAGMQPRPAGSLPVIKALTARHVCFDGEKETIKMKKYVCLIFCFAITGCTSVAQLEQRLGQQWIGKDGKSLIASLGEPDKVVDDGPGGQIFCYVKITSYTLPFRESMKPIFYTSKKGLHYNVVDKGRYYPLQTFTKGRTSMFWINPEGKIYRVSIVR